MWDTGVFSQLSPKKPQPALPKRGNEDVEMESARVTKSISQGSFLTALRATGVGAPAGSTHRQCWGAGGLQAAPWHSPWHRGGSGGLQSQRHTSSGQRSCRLLSKERRWWTISLGRWWLSCQQPKPGPAVARRGCRAQGSTRLALWLGERFTAGPWCPVAARPLGCWDAAAGGHPALAGRQELGHAAGRQRGCRGHGMLSLHGGTRARTWS